MDGATILIVDDEPRVLDALEAVLAAEFRILRASSGPAALERLRGEDVAVVLTDYKMPGMTGVEMLRECQALAPEAIRLVLTAYTDVDSLMDAVNTGHIYHFVAKPWDSNELLVILRRAVERHALAQENARLRDELEIAYNAVRRQVAEIRARPTAFDTVTGAGTGLREAIGLARKVLDTGTTVLLRGETGTGKELFARLIHDSGSRRERKFVAQNCGALSETLLESELFGHVRGAFTGAIAERRGLFEEAHGGTILLDEVGEMTPTTQLRLLRVLQEGEVRRVGESTSRKVDVRIIAATNADLESPGDRRRLSPGSLLSAERVPDHAAAVAGPRAGYSGAGRALPAPAPRTPGRAGLHRRRARLPADLPVSRQRARAGERGRAGGGPGRRRPPHRRRASLRARA